MMKIKQHSFALLTVEAFHQLQASLVRPTGEYVTVKNENGSDVQSEVFFGGFIRIGEKTLNGKMWIAVLGCGLDIAFSEFRQTLGAIGVQLGEAVGVEIFTWNDTPEGVDFSQLDNAIDPNMWTNINAWLSQQGLSIVSPTTQREMVERIFEMFCAGFAVGQDVI